MPDDKVSGEASEECRVALQVAMKVIGERCGMGFGDGLEAATFDSELSVSPPKEILEIAHNDSKMSRKEKIDAVKDKWSTKLAEGWVKSVLPYLKEGTKEYKQAVESMATKVAEGIVD